MEMEINEPLRNSIVDHLSPIFGSRLDLKEYQPVSGGCINNGGYLRTNYGPFFLKFNSHAFKGMFETEASGLKLLENANALHTPTAYVSGVSEDGQHFLVTEWIGTGKPVADFWEELGRGLAQLHSQQNTHYGLDFDNYIGSLPQHNDFTNNWSKFFIDQRLEPQVELGLKQHTLDRSISNRIRGLYPFFEQWFPEEPPSLLHGDLWSGNLLVDENGKPAIIDPAVYYGHREMELAFTSLFGGFNERFQAAYQEAWPLVPNFEERIDLYNLYPLLVHVNLFGGPFVNQLNSVITKFTSAS